MPKFTDKIESAQDYNQVRHLMKANKKMSQVLWELSLRPDAYKKDESPSRNNIAPGSTKNIKYFSGKTKKTKSQSSLKT